MVRVFHKRERRAVVAHHSNFALAAGRGEIARDENVAETAQVPISVGFAADASLARAMFGGIASGAGRQMRGRGRAQALAGGAINYREHETRQHWWKNLLHDFEFPFDCLAANDEAQIILPEFAEPAEMIHQDLKTERTPDTQ
jgi:hypothetical protein